MASKTTVGSLLVAAEKKKRRFHLKIYIASIVVGIVLGLSMSGFWQGWTNRCPKCWKPHYKQVHRFALGPEGPFAYWCQMEGVSKHSLPPRGARLVYPRTRPPDEMNLAPSDDR